MSAKASITETALAGVLVFEPAVFGDDRGFFFESYNAKTFAALTGQAPVFVQDNHSRSTHGVLRGLHYQIRQSQGKLVRVTAGEVFDVVVDMRRSSATYGKWIGVTLSAANKKQLWIPPGFAHGFVTLSDSAEFLYKTTDYWAPEHERTLIWNDATVGIEWPIADDPQLAAKDRAGLAFESAEAFA